MDYEPCAQPAVSTTHFPTGTYVCATCNMAIDIDFEENHKTPTCPCCEQSLFLSIEEEKQPVSQVSLSIVRF
ncbi:hypothetical protein [Vibrio sp. MA40-2]|uniref:hypothetical protein n=1 Tax=Vibrio sp. MA40-2 TaxID=3391828 RepID=UPI0039A68654